MDGPGETLGLGHLALRFLVAAGGMGQVWNGLHRPSGEPVAVKVLNPGDGPAERFAAAFHAEVHAIARLDHPNVVRILDFGEVPPETAAASGGRLAPGAPYLAMTLADHTVRQEVGTLGWDRVRPILLDLLAGLAHAHARGCIHRDVKPSNLLVLGPEQRVQLADFGLASLGDDAAPGTDLRLEFGTPAYMSPEQVQANPRAFGPWTDLYAVGCVGWELVSGAPPFGVRAADSTLLAQLHREPGPLQPRFAVPAGTEAWLRQLLRKDPRERYQRAADAACQLRALAGADPVGSAATPARPEPVTTVVWEGQESAPRQPSATPAPLRHAPPRVAPLPDQAPALTGAGSEWLRGLGLGLCSLRQTPMVGREESRQTLWRSLVAVGETGQPACTLVIGSSGVGKSRLAQWLGEAAHEAGAAEVLQAHHSPGRDPPTGWGPCWPGTCAACR